MVFSKQIGGYTLGKKIGEGKYGTVRLVKRQGSDETFAIKIVDKEKLLSEDDWKRIRRETTVLTKLQHPNIINLFDVIETDQHICIVTEYANGGDLYEYITKQSHRRLSKSDAFGLFRQMVDAIDYCHSHFVVHRDLKPENVFLTHDHKIKIGDFGFARTFNPGDVLSTPCGSFAYAAPEVIAGRNYLGPSSDVWSLGCILYAMLTGKFPFEGNNNVETIMRVKEGKFNDNPHLHNNEIRDFLREIFRPIPAQRLTARQIAEHSIMWQEKSLLAKLLHPFAVKLSQKKSQNALEVTLRKSFSESELRSSGDSLGSSTRNSPLPKMRQMTSKKEAIPPQNRGLPGPEEETKMEAPETDDTQDYAPRRSFSSSDVRSTMMILPPT